MLDGELKFCRMLNAEGVDVDDDVAKLKHEITIMKKFKMQLIKLA